MIDEFKPKRGRLGRYKLRKNVLLWGVITLLVLAAGATAAYYVKKYNDSKKEIARLSDPEQVAKDEKSRLINKVGRLTQLPQEDPTVATVSDINKLKDQKFFENGQNGDRLLIYTKAKRAILYRPSTDKIINIAPLTIGDNNDKSSNTNDQNP